MKRIMFFLGVMSLLTPFSLWGQTAHYGYDPLAPYIVPGVKAPLPDLTVTPGAIDPSLTKAVLCDPKFHTGTKRNVTEKEKKEVCVAYGQTVGCPGKGYELDHDISLELGGSNDKKNMWAQQVDAPGLIGFHTKDVVENRAHAAVCSGKLSLQDAQKGISGDWFKFGWAQGFITEKDIVKDSPRRK